MHSVVELEVFSGRATKLLKDRELTDVITAVAFHPFLGDEIPGTGGVRKLRIPAKGKGKRGGARIIYYFYDETVPIFLITCYGKNERDDLTGVQLKAVATFAGEIKKRARNRTRS